MKERIAEHCGRLPEPVLDKLLNVEAGELDTLLTYPKGIRGKVKKIISQEDLVEAHHNTNKLPNMPSAFKTCFVCALLQLPSVGSLTCTDPIGIWPSGKKVGVQTVQY